MDGFWQNGVAVESSVNAMHYLNGTRYRSVVLGSYRGLEDLLLAYGPQPSFDDMAWYGLAYSRVYEVTRRAEFLSISRTIFDWIWSGGWDRSVCDGGVWFDNNFAGKQTIENVQMVQLGARLARLLFSSNSSSSHDYLEKAQLVWRWIVARQLYDNVTHQVFDGIDLDTCVCTDRTTFTYTSGTLVGGLVELFQVTGDAGYLATAHNITATVIRNLTAAGGVLMEPCDWDASCDLDANIFKGIFMKNLRYLLDVDPRAAAAPAYRAFVATNIAAVKANAMCEPDSRERATTTGCHIVYLGKSRR
jgi:predicted alpha-1,6-mannanase (GH76 family)